MKNHRRSAKVTIPFIALLAVATLAGQSRPTCTPSQDPLEVTSIAPADCEGLPHPTCVGEW